MTDGELRRRWVPRICVMATAACLVVAGANNIWNQEARFPQQASTWTIPLHDPPFR